MLIGYNFGGEFNDSYMFDSNDKNLPVCKQCGYIIDYNYLNPMFRLKKKIYDISYTYDGRVIVSLKFKEFCYRNNYKGIEFKNLPNDDNFYVFDIKNIINYDIDKKKLNYEKYCELCKNYESVTPARPILLKNIVEPLEDNFYSTDIHFASGNEKRPLLIMGTNTYQKMKKEKFKGILYFMIEQK